MGGKQLVFPIWARAGHHTVWILLGIWRGIYTTAEIVAKLQTSPTDDYKCGGRELTPTGQTQTSSHFILVSQIQAGGILSSDTSTSSDSQQDGRKLTSMKTMHNTTLSLSSRPQNWHSSSYLFLNTQEAMHETRNYSQSTAALFDPSSWLVYGFSMCSHMTSARAPVYCESAVIAVSAAQQQFCTELLWARRSLWKII